MRSLFRSKHKVTQAFGVNVEYYKQFGLKAHEGIDLIPTGTVWDVLCLADGVVVKDEDNALSGAYGVNVTVWHPKLRKATQYCHFKENYVVNGQVVSMGEKLGLMGKTGNTTGAHVHLNLFETDENGIRLNKNNGYLGGIDPLPFIEEEVPVEVAPDTVPVEKSKLKDLEDRKEWWNQVRALLNVEDNVTVVLAEVDKLIKYEDAVIQKDNQLSNAQSEIASLKAEVTRLQDINTKQALEASVLTDKASDLEEKYKVSTQNYGVAMGKIKELEEKINKPQSTGWQKIVDGFFELLRR